MTFKTRHKDVPYEQIKPCFEGLISDPGEETWEKHRGTEITVELPALEKTQNCFYRCNGPFYQISRENHEVCVHIAEIGD